MKTAEIMTPRIAYAGEEDTLMSATQKMRDIDVGVLPVKDGNDQLAGVLTDRDIVVRAVAQGKLPAATQVREVMTPGAISCGAAQEVEEALEIMKQEQIRRLIVLDGNHIAVGIVALGDLARKVPDKQLAGRAVEEISKPT